MKTALNGKIYYPTVVLWIILVLKRNKTVNSLIPTFCRLNAEPRDRITHIAEPVTTIMVW